MARARVRIVGTLLALAFVSAAQGTLHAQQSFFTVTPCRVFDSRLTAYGGPSPIPGGTRGTIPVAGHCGISAGATAVSFNLTVTQPTAAGHVRLFAAAAALPTTSVVNYRPGQTRANNGVTALGPAGAVDYFVAQPAGTSAHIVIDVNGFFGEPAPPGAIPAKTPRIAATQFEPSARRASDPMPVSGVGRAILWWDRSQDLGGWDRRLPIPDNVCNSCPQDYVIEGSSNGGTTWTPLLTVIGNPYYTRAHVVDLTGQTSVRLRLTRSVNDAPNFYLEIQVHDARDGVDDWWVFFGDSLTDNVFRGITGQAPLGTGRFGDNVNARDATRWPVAHNGAVSAGVMDHYLEVVGGRTRFEQWMADFPGKYVCLVIGTNDINGYSDHAVTAAELDIMQGKMELLIQYAQAAGKTAVVPTLRWTNTNPYTGVNIAAWNARLWNVVLPKYPGAIRGADTYTRAVAMGSAGLTADRTHLNDAGATLTQEDWVNWVFANIYQ